MRKLILTSITLFIFSIVSYGQLEKGNYLLGGTGNMDFSSTEQRSMFGVGVNPSLGYFLTSKIALIASVPLSFRRSKSDNWQSTYTSYGLAPSVRYYFLKKEKSALFTSTGFGLFQFDSKSELDNFPDVSKDSGTYTSGHIGLGYVYFLNKSIGLEVGLDYRRQKQEDFDATSELNLNVGFQIYFGRGGKKSEK